MYLVSSTPLVEKLRMVNSGMVHISMLLHSLLVLVHLATMFTSGRLQSVDRPHVCGQLRLTVTNLSTKVAGHWGDSGMT